MAEPLIETLALMRGVVGYLGERDQKGWWQSGFFSAGSRAFLSPVFGRTQILAQCAGVTQAAALVHDERIGVGQVFHLFRLPEDLEQAVHQALQRPELGRRLIELVASNDTALAWLRETGGSGDQGGVGPLRVGMEHSVREPQPWRLVAANYGRAFAAGEDIFPYFTGRP